MCFESRARRASAVSRAHGGEGGQIVLVEYYVAPVWSAIFVLKGDGGLEVELLQAAEADLGGDQPRPGPIPVRDRAGAEIHLTRHGRFPIPFRTTPLVKVSKQTLGCAQEMALGRAIR